MQQRELRAAATLVLLLWSAQAWADAFDGNWRGSGWYQNPDQPGQRASTNTLTVQATAFSLRFQECWEVPAQESSRKHSCITSSYERRGNSLFHGERKVGDVFPAQVIIYDGTPQVGEQIVMASDTDLKLHYRYSYVNADGAFEHREAVFISWPPGGANRSSSLAPGFSFLGFSN